MTGSEARLAGGPLNAALANEIVRLVAEYTGRGATRSRAFLHDDIVVCLLEDSATKAEVSLIGAGKTEMVRHQRDALQRAMEPALVEAVERLTGRSVRSFLSGISTEAESSVEMFVLEPEPNGEPDSAAD
jgi:uncharacterized protein YbcI